MFRGRSVKLRSRGGVAHRKWANLGAIFRRNMIHVLGHAMDNIRAEQQIMTEAPEGVRTSIDEDEEPVPFWQQGDLAFYSKDSLKKRYELRHHDDVMEQLQLWWYTALRSMQSGDVADAHELVRERYVEVSIRIYKAMIEDFDLREAEKSAADDWEHDSRGATTLGRERFMDSMFELADVWTHSMEPIEYSFFLKTLFGQVAQGEPPDQYFWREVKDIEYGGYAGDEHDGHDEEVAETPREGADAGSEKEVDPEPPKVEPKAGAEEKEPKAAKSGDGKDKKKKGGGDGNDKDAAATKIQSTARGKAVRDKKPPSGPSKPPKAAAPAAASAAAPAVASREPQARKGATDKPPKPQATLSRPAAEPKPITAAPPEEPIAASRASAPPRPVAKPTEERREVAPMDWGEREAALKKENDGRVWRHPGRSEEQRVERMDWGEREMADPNNRRPGEHAGPPGWIMRDGQAVQQIEKRGGNGLNEGRIRASHEGRTSRRDALDRAAAMANRDQYNGRWQLDDGSGHVAGMDDQSFGFGAVNVHGYGKVASGSPGRGPGAGYTRLGPIGGEAEKPHEYTGPYRVPPPASMAIVESPRGLVLVASSQQPPRAAASDAGAASKEAAAAQAAHDARVAAAQAARGGAPGAHAVQPAQMPRALPMTTVPVRGGGDMMMAAPRSGAPLPSLGLQGQQAAGRWGGPLGGKTGRRPRSVIKMGGRERSRRTVGMPRDRRHGLAGAGLEVTPWPTPSPPPSLFLAPMAIPALVCRLCSPLRRGGQMASWEHKIAVRAELPDTRAGKDGGARSANPQLDGGTPSPQGSGTATSASPPPKNEQAANAARLQQHVPHAYHDSASPTEVHANFVVFADPSPERRGGCLPQLGFGNRKSKKARRAERRVTGPGLNNPYAQPGVGGGGAAAQLPQLHKQRLVAAKQPHKQPVRREAAGAAAAAGWSTNLSATQAMALHNLNTLPGVYTDKSLGMQPLNRSPQSRSPPPIRTIAPSKPFAIAPSQLPPASSDVLPAIAASAPAVKMKG